MGKGLSPENLVYLAAAAAAGYAQGRDAQELTLLSAFFEVLGDDLALLALGAPSEGRSAGE